MTKRGDLLCKVTGKPFLPVCRGGAVVCSECGEVFIRDAPQSSGLTMPMKCRVTRRMFYPYESTVGSRVVIRCSECHRIIYEPEASK